MQCMMCTWKLRTTSFQIMTVKQPNAPPMAVLPPMSPASVMRFHTATEEALKEMKETKRMRAPMTRYTPELPCTRLNESQ